MEGDSKLRREVCNNRIVERFNRKSLTYPLAQLNKVDPAGHLKFELYGEQVGARTLYSLCDASQSGSLTLVPRGTAREIFYTMNALLHTLGQFGIRPPRVGVIDADRGIVDKENND